MALLGRHDQRQRTRIAAEQARLEPGELGGACAARCRAVHDIPARGVAQQRAGVEQAFGLAAVDRGKRGAPRPFAVGIDRALPEGGDLAPLALPFIAADRDRDALPLSIGEMADDPPVGAVEAGMPRDGLGRKRTASLRYDYCR